MRANDRLASVVPAFHQHVRTQVANELERRILLKNYNRINRFERRQDIAPLGLGAYRSVGTLQSLDRGVAIQPDDESVAVTARPDEDVDVAGVQQVEDPVREDEPPGMPISPCVGLGPRENFRGGIADCPRQ